LCPREAACTARREHSASASESIAYAALRYAQKQLPRTNYTIESGRLIIALVCSDRV